MKHILDIALKDIRQTTRDKMTFLFLLIMPILFTIMFGFAFGGFRSTAVDERPVIGYQDSDGSLESQSLKTLLENQSEMRVEEMAGTPDSFTQMVLDGKLAAAVMAPAGYGQSLQSGDRLPVQVSIDPASMDGMTAQGIIQTASSRNFNAAAAARTAVSLRGTADEQFDQYFQTAAEKWLNPPVGIELTGPGAGKAEVTSSGTGIPISHTAPAMMIQFSLAGLLTAAQVLVQERKSRCMQRLLTTRAARHEILLGHFLAIFLTIFTQFILLIVFAQLVLGLDYMRAPAATLLMMTSTALFVAAIGLLIGSLAKSDDQAVIFSLAPMFVLSGLGGAWMPLDAVGAGFRSVGQVTPVAIALDGFKNIVARGLNIESVLIPAAALVGYAIICFALAVWKFKFE